jgi:4,5-DOPA dioxygenase extradiol
MPVVFVGHGSPMNAIVDSTFSHEWERIGASLPRPTAILCVSAHWQTHGPRITAMAKPRTIHDFGGFPEELFAVQYPAPGSPTVASSVITMAGDSPTILADHEWGLDHGAWSVLLRMVPNADVPVLQLSLDVGLTPANHVAFAQRLAALRSQGVLILASGNIVHNLRLLNWRPEAQPLDWALEFDATSARLLEEGRITDLANWQSLGSAASIAINSAEHYLPMLYAAALRNPSDSLTFFNERIDMASVGMRSFVLGK